MGPVIFLVDDDDGPLLPHDLRQDGRDLVEEKRRRFIPLPVQLPRLFVLFGAKLLDPLVKGIGQHAKLLGRQRRTSFGQRSFLGDQRILDLGVLGGERLRQPFEFGDGLRSGLRFGKQPVAVDCQNRRDLLCDDTQGQQRQKHCRNPCPRIGSKS